MKSKTEQFYIYALQDPNTREVCYIGKTTDPWRRVQEHLRGRGRRTRLADWLNMLALLNRPPHLSVLETQVDPTDVNDRERWWIAFWHYFGASLRNANVEACRRRAWFLSQGAEFETVMEAWLQEPKSRDSAGEGELSLS